MCTARQRVFASRGDKPIHYTPATDCVRAHLASSTKNRPVTTNDFSKRNVIGRRQPTRISMATMYNGAIFSAVSALNDAENHTCGGLIVCPISWRSDSRCHGYRADADTAFLSRRRRQTINLYARAERHCLCGDARLTDSCRSLLRSYCH